MIFAQTERHLATSTIRLPGSEAWPIRKAYGDPDPSISFFWLVAVFSVSILCIVIYSNTLKSPFVFDDKAHIKDNPAIRITQINLKNLYNAGFKGPNPSRPVPAMSFALNYYIGQYDVRGYHIFNIIIHITNGILIYFLSMITLKRSSEIQGQHSSRFPESQSVYDSIPSISLLVALLFITHPLQTQSVTYTVQRMNSMAATFYLLSFLLYIKGRFVQRLSRIRLEPQRGSKIKTKSANSKIRNPILHHYLWFTASALAWMLALGSKQNSAILPLLILVYEWYFFQDLDMGWLRRNLKYFICISLFLVFISFVYLGSNPLELLRSSTDYANKEFTFMQRILTQPRVVTYYLSLIFYPHPSRLNLDYDFALSHSLVNPLTTLVSLGAIIGLIGLAFRLAKRERLISFCILWFLGNLVIESSIVPLAVIFEHRVYLPSMLVILLVVILIHRAIPLQWIRISILCAVLVLFSIWTYGRNSVWGDPVILWRDCALKSPKKARPHNNLGDLLANRGEKDEAIKHFREALRIKPAFAEAHCNLGIVLAEQGQLEEGISHFLEAIRIKPNYARAHTNLGAALLDQGKIPEAIKPLSKALEHDPHDPVAHYNLGYALRKQKKLGEAIKHFSEAVRLDPNYVRAHNMLGVTLNKLGKTSKAISYFSEALRIEPDFVEAHNNLGKLFYSQGKIDKAISHFSQALRINPELGDVHNSMGAALAAKKSMEEAITHFSEALRLNPRDPNIYFNFGNVYIELGRFDKAVDHYLEALRINPDYAEAHKNIGMAFMRLGEFSKATKHLSETLRIKPENTEAYYYLGIISFNQGKLNEAVTNLSKVVQIRPDHADAHNSLGAALYSQGKANEAIVHFSEALRIKPDNAHAHNNLGSALASQGRFKEAVVHFREALRIDPNYREAQSNLNRVLKKGDVRK
jgi:tetratricopeptide (TPR) repeat protein